jgi:hypothetical protein
LLPYAQPLPDVLPPHGLYDNELRLFEARQFALSGSVVDEVVVRVLGLRHSAREQPSVADDDARVRLTDACDLFCYEQNDDLVCVRCDVDAPTRSSSDYEKPSVSFEFVKPFAGKKKLASYQGQKRHLKEAE